MSETVVTFCVAVAETERLDRFLAEQLSLSRTVAARLIADKRVSADGRPLRASALLSHATVVSVSFPQAAQPRMYTPAQRDLTFVFEDEHLAAGQARGPVVHPGPGHWDDSLVNVLTNRGTALSPGRRPDVPVSCTGLIATRRVAADRENR